MMDISSNIKHTPMLLYIFEDEHGWIYEPHGSEIEVWCTTFEGSKVLKASGWRPYQMHRVSRYVHDSLLIDGMLLQWRADLPDAALLSPRLMPFFSVP
jgi:hypothetical protein